MQIRASGEIIDGYYRMKPNNSELKNEVDENIDINGDGIIKDEDHPVYKVYFKKQVDGEPLIY